MDNAEILAIFFGECEESLAATELGLAVCKSGLQDANTINSVFRAVHSIKGGAGAFGFPAMQSYTHIFETLLSAVREETISLDGELIEVLLLALDTLSDHVTAASGGSEPPDDRRVIVAMNAAVYGDENCGEEGPAKPCEDASSIDNELISTPREEDDSASDLDLYSMLDDIVDSFEATASGKWPVYVWPHAGTMINGCEPLLLLRELAQLGGVCLRCDMSRIPMIEDLDVCHGYLGWTFDMPADVAEDTVREIFDFFGGECSIAIGAEVPIKDIQSPPPRPPPAPCEESLPAAPIPDELAVSSMQVTPAIKEPIAGHSIRIDLIKLDQLIDAVGELVIAQAMMAQRLVSEGMAAGEELALLEGLTRDIQEGAMSIRAQPIGSVFSRVPRILRELAASTGKQVRLVVSGESTELDRAVIERLGEPLTHLIRNAVDHGIESPETRLAAGKPAEGVVTLSAEHRAGRILIRISDDGQGINRRRVLAKAIEKGLVAADAQISSEDIDQLIFEAGFSTATIVSNVSGRGVGMDVVRQNVKELGGRITIESEQGRGTTFVLTLPLTLAISDGMIVNVGDQTLVVPLAHVVESLRPSAGEVQGLGSGHQMLNVRGKFIPIVALGEAIGATGGLKEPELGVLIVVDTEIAGQAALLVDEICDQRQFVIKSLETHYRAVEGVAGATILGDGRVALIIDVDCLVASILPAPARQAA